MTTSCQKADMFSLQLHELGDGSGYGVQSVDIFQPDFKHRLTFSTRNNIHSVLVPELAAYLEDMIARIDKDTRVHSEPDAVVDLPGLTLGRLRVLTFDPVTDAKRFVVRFAYFIGGLQAAFNVDTRLALPTVSHREAIAVSALVDICTPALNIIAHREFLGEGRSSDETLLLAKLDGIDEVQNELSFYLQLLKRYVGSLNPGHTAPEPIVGPADVHNIREYPQKLSAIGGRS